MTTIFGAQGVFPTLRGQPTNVTNLQAGETLLIPAGTWDVQVGPNTSVQQYDSIQNAWRSIGGDSTVFRYVNSDGVNYRVANQTGCVVGAVITNAGTGYLVPPTVADGSSSSAKYQAILGPIVNTITVTNGGSNYVYPPTVQIQAPGNPGIQATAWATIASGAVTAITVTDQGANYNFVPVISIINDPRDTTGAGAAATATTTGANTVAAIVVTDHGVPYTTPGTVPTLTITAVSGGTSAAATAVVCLPILTCSFNSFGSGYAGGVEVSALGTGLSASATYTNPKVQSNLVRTRKASILITASTGGALLTTGQSLLDGGIYAGVSATAIVYGSPAGAGTQLATPTFTYGGRADTVALYAV